MTNILYGIKLNDKSNIRIRLDIMARETETKEILGEVLFQFIPQGNYVKVIAVDPITNTEIIMVGDRRSGKQTLERIAIQKLRYVIEKNLNNRTNNIENPEN